MPRQRSSHTEKFESIFGTEKLKETFNRSAALHLQQHGFPEGGGSDEEKATLQRLLDASKDKDYITVGYKKGNRSGDFGRWYAVGAVSMQRMSRRLRHTLCKGLWVDLDFANCQPVLLAQICQRMGIHAPCLDRYVGNREEMLAELQEAGGLPDRDTAKKLILECLFGSSCKVPGVTWWEELRSEFKGIASFVANHPSNAVFLTNTKASGEHNLNARVMNAVLFDMENRCLEHLYDYLREQGCILSDMQCALIFDGLQIRENEHNRGLLDRETFLQDSSRHICDATGFTVDIKVKAFDEAYDLPDGFESTITDISVIDIGDDRAAADLFLERFPGRLIKSRRRLFWCSYRNIYESDLRDVKDGVMSAMRELRIFARTHHDTLVPYSDSTRHVENCIKMIFSDARIVDDGFVDVLRESNIRYLAFEDGIYSFSDRQFLPYPVDGVYFTFKINRPFPHIVSDAVLKDLMDKVIDPIFPDEKQLDHFLHCVARALAGEIWDKKWYLGIGERNSGKGVICYLLELAFQSFVQTINSENFLYARVGGGGDTAKKQSWMFPLELKRIAFSNEIQFQEGIPKWTATS